MFCRYLLLSNVSVPAFFASFHIGYPFQARQFALRLSPVPSPILSCHLPARVPRLVVRISSAAVYILPVQSKMVLFEGMLTSPRINAHS
jgi:hypothetical protein